MPTSPARSLVPRVRGVWQRLEPHRRPWAAAALVCGIVLAALLVGLSTGWTMSRIGDAASDSSMAVDSAGGVHVAYYDPSQTSSNARSIVYGEKGLLGWTLTRVDALTSNEWVESTSTAALPDGRAWIVYAFEPGYDGAYSAYDTTIRLAWGQHGAWAFVELPEHGFAPSVAVAPDGRVYVAYLRLTGPESDGNLTLLEGDAGHFSERVLTQAPFGPEPHTQVALDPSGYPHVAFGTSFSLAYATNETGSWAIQWLNGTGVNGPDTWYSGPSMAVDSVGSVHLSYQGADPTTGRSSILYETNKGGRWTTLALDRLNLAVSTSSAVDRRGHVHVAYYDQENGTLKYATNAGGYWSTGIVGPAIGGNVPLAIDVGPDGRVHMAFYSAGGLGYATNGVDASNFGAFVVTNLAWWSAPAAVCVYSLYRVLARAPRKTPRAT